MSFHRFSLLTIIAACATSASAADPAPRLSAIAALGQQNIVSLTSDPRTGGPQGISIRELPGACAHIQAQQVDAIYAIRAGSRAPIPHIQLAHPSHVPGVKGSRPFVSDGPLSRSPGTNRRRSDYTYNPYPATAQTPAVPTQQFPVVSR